MVDCLYNAVYIALKELAKLPLDEPRLPRRRAIIVLSDGDDTSSLVSFDEEVLGLASRSETVIYTIGLGPSALVTTRNNQDGRFVLRRLAQQTGGASSAKRFLTRVRLSRAANGRCGVSEDRLAEL